MNFGPTAISSSGPEQGLARTADMGRFGEGLFRRGVDFIASRNLGAYLALSLICLLAFGIGLARLPPTDRDESRFMQATKQMVETGDYIHIRVQEEPRRKKPIGIHWLQAAAVKVLDQPLSTPWPYRLPSAVAAWLTVLLVYGAGRYLFNARAALIAGAVTATCPLVIAEAHLAKTDAVLLFCVTLAMTALARLYVPPADGQVSSSPWHAAIFWLGVGAAVLIKGPVVLLIIGATLITLCTVDQSTAILKALRAAWGVPLALLVVAPWIATLVIGGESGFIAAAVKQDLLPKLIGGQETHGAPPGSHLVAAVLTFWPWSLIVPVALIAVWSQRHEPAVRFCLAWLVPGWLAFEAIPTKLPHYILPLLPAAALLVGVAIDHASHIQMLLRGRGGLAWRGLWALLSVALGLVLIWIAQHFGISADVMTQPWVIVAAALAGASALLVILAGDRIGPGFGFVALAVLALAFSTIVVGRVVPGLERLWVSERLAAAVARHPTAEPVSLVGFREPSAVFLLGTQTRLTDAMGATANLLARAGAIAAVDEPALASITAAIESAGYKAVPLETIAGQNYARGTPVTLTLLTIARP